jgi:hypothetical protein
VVGRIRACWAVARGEAPGRGCLAVWFVSLSPEGFLCAFPLWLDSLVLGPYQVIQYILSL